MCKLVLLLLQVPKCLVLVQFFWARPKIELHLVLFQNIWGRLKNWIYWMQIIFWSGTKILVLAQYVHKSIFVLVQKIWISPKCFGTCMPCFVLLKVPISFVPVQIFLARPKIKSQFVPFQNILWRNKNWIYCMDIIFWSGTKCLGLAQCVNQFLVGPKKIWTSPYFETCRRTKQ